MKHTTIKDVAKALNVSISTVSRAFNDKYDIHPDTRNDWGNCAGIRERFFSKSIDGNTESDGGSWVSGTDHVV